MSPPRPLFFYPYDHQPSVTSRHIITSVSYSHSPETKSRRSDLAHFPVRAHPRYATSSPFKIRHPPSNIHDPQAALSTDQPSNIRGLNFQNPSPTVGSPTSLVCPALPFGRPLPRTRTNHPASVHTAAVTLSVAKASARKNSRSSSSGDVLVQAHLHSGPRSAAQQDLSDPLGAKGAHAL